MYVFLGTGNHQFLMQHKEELYNNHISKLNLHLSNSSRALFLNSNILGCMFENFRNPPRTLPENTILIGKPSSFRLKSVPEMDP